MECIALILYNLSMQFGSEARICTMNSLSVPEILEIALPIFQLQLCTGKKMGLLQLVTID